MRNTTATREAMETSGSSLVAGRQITPSLRLVRELGQGGMGAVWVADHLSLRTQVAVKFLAERSLEVPDAVARFSAEAAAAARIRSPHVVQVFDHGVSEGLPYIVMELLEGEDLARRLERERALPPGEVIAIVRQACKALERAHAMGIVHRDVKPANLFLVSGMGETFVKVLDFGLAKHQDEGLSGLTESQAVFGTPYYVSPEQAQSAHTATAQSDLWSMAVVAYECLTGQRPFTSQSLMGLCLALTTGRFTPATAVRPELPAAIDEWFSRALQRDPAARFASAGQLAQTLGEALSGAAGAPPPQPAEPPVSPQPPASPERAASSEPSLPAGPSAAPGPATGASVAKTWSRAIGHPRALRRLWLWAAVVGAAAAIGWASAGRAPSPSSASPATAADGPRAPAPVPASSLPSSGATAAVPMLAASTAAASTAAASTAAAPSADPVSPSAPPPVALVPGPRRIPTTWTIPTAASSRPAASPKPAVSRTAPTNDLFADPQR